MRRFFPILLLILVALVFFQPVFIKRLLPIPSDALVGLYHPFRDLYVKDYPRGIPFKNFLITDPVLQQYPWRNLSISLEKKAQLPLWNPYSFSGMPLLANQQSAVFYPFNLFFFILPFPATWTMLVILQPLLAGLFMYLYLRNLKLPTVSSLLGSIVFAFSGFSFVWLEWGVIVQTGLWLPLVLLAIDKIFSETKYRIGWSIIFVSALSCAFFGGHLQTFFYLGLVSCLYVLARLFQNKGLKKALMLGVLFVIFFLTTLVQWMPLMQLIQLSARGIDHISYYTPGWFVPWQHLVQFLAPDFFGNPATMNYSGVWNYMEFSGYVGLIPLLFTLCALFFVRAKRVYFFGGLLLTALLFALPTPIAKLPFIFHIPFIETSQPTRLLYIIDFCLAVLSAIGLASLHVSKKKIWIPFLTLFLLLLALWAVVPFYQTMSLTQIQMVVAKQNLIFPTIILFFTALLLSLWQILPAKRQYIMTLLILLALIDLFRFGYKFNTFSKTAYLYPPTRALQFLKENAGNQRIMETSREIMSPNISVMYHLQSVDGYDPLYLRRYGELIAASERGKPDIAPPFGFNRIVTPQRYDSTIVNLLGVKYVLSLTDIPTLPKVFEEGQTKVYENTNAFPRAFFVGSVISSKSKEDSIQKMFDKNINLSTTAIIENDNLHQQYGAGKAMIQSYEPNRVVIKTENSSSGFLILTDMYYPTWKAAVDGKKTQTFLADYVFRGIEVPSGNHTITFSNSLW